MKILIVSLNFAEKTGTGKTTLGRATHLARVGHEVTVLAGYPHYPEWRLHDGYKKRLRSTEVIDGVRVVHTWHSIPDGQAALGRALIEATYGLSGLTALPGLKKPDVVLGVLPILAGGVLAVLAARRFRVPLGIHVQDLSGRAAVESGMKGARRLAGPASAVERFVLRRADAIAAIAPGFEAPICAYGVDPARIHLVPNWTPVREPEVPRQQVRDLLGLPQDRPIALYSGNIGNKQGLETVIDAARLSQARGSDLLWVLVGEGNRKRELVALSEDYRLTNLLFLPLQDEDFYPSVLGAADVLLLSQRGSVTNMSFPSKLAVYFASGTPVVAAVNRESDTAQELLTANVGEVVPPEDPVRLLEGVESLVRHPLRAAALAANARAYARTRHSEASLASALEAFVEHTAGVRSQPLQAAA